jgi:cytochrome c biogenesis protein CcmG, thiol:disulfide interchange protein DsbE
MNRRVLLAGLLLILPLIAVLYLNLGHDPSAVDSPLIGRAAPLFTLRPAGGGEPISLAALRGRPVVLNFWASWCVPCAQEHDVLTAAARALAGRVTFLGLIYEDGEEAALAALGSTGAPAYPSLLDPGDRTAVAYGIYGVPETFFIDAGGRIRDKFVGPLTPAALDQRLRRLTGAPNS